jgi:hypothetical protein
MRVRFAASVLACLAVLSSPASAQEKRVASRDGSRDAAGPATDAGPDGAKAERPAPPEPYGALAMMRSPGPGTGAKVDLTAAPFSKDGVAGVAGVFLVSGQYKVTDGFGVGLRLGFDRVSVSGADPKLGFLNPQITGVYVCLSIICPSVSGAETPDVPGEIRAARGPDGDVESTELHEGAAPGGVGGRARVGGQRGGQEARNPEELRVSVGQDRGRAARGGADAGLGA